MTNPRKAWIEQKMIFLPYDGQHAEKRNHLLLCHNRKTDRFYCGTLRIFQRLHVLKIRGKANLISM